MSDELPWYELRFQVMCVLLNKSRAQTLKMWRVAMFAAIGWALTYLLLVKEVV
tara:strand:+ start:858 stop:1016 length:159 start_codon:yes stop_codon:yes gene_type:complete